MPDTIGFYFLLTHAIILQLGHDCIPFFFFFFEDQVEAEGS